MPRNAAILAAAQPREESQTMLAGRMPRVTCDRPEAHHRRIWLELRGLRADNQGMKTTLPPRGEIAVRGEQIYAGRLRAILEPAHNGEIALINIETGEYELDPDHLAAIKKARARWPKGLLFGLRVGHPAIAHIGARTISTRSE